MGGGWDGHVNVENVEIHCALYLIDKSKQLGGDQGIHRSRGEKEIKSSLIRSPDSRVKKRNHQIKSKGVVEKFILNQISLGRNKELRGTEANGPGKNRGWVHA
jgi:hypothetical protein